MFQLVKDVKHETVNHSNQSRPNNQSTKTQENYLELSNFTFKPPVCSNINWSLHERIDQLLLQICCVWWILLIILFSCKMIDEWLNILIIIDLIMLKDWMLLIPSHETIYS